MTGTAVTSKNVEALNPDELEKEYRKLRKLIPPECVCEQCKIKYGYSKM